jgi:hypothetical protein
MSRLCLLIGLCLLPILALAEPPRSEHRHGSGLNGQKCRELTEEEQGRLVVEWDKPRIEDDRHGKRICIPGQAYLKSADGKSREPVKGVVIAAVIISHRPDTKPNWSEGYEDEEANGAGLFINWSPEARLQSGDKQVLKEGGFVAAIPCDRIRRQPGEKKSFQVALSLGRAKGDMAWWSNHDPALKM